MAVDSYFKNILAFTILMGGERILTKSPDYLLEKFGRYIGSMSPSVGEAWQGGLDSDNRHFFDTYMQKWFKGHGGEPPGPKPSVKFTPDKP